MVPMGSNRRNVDTGLVAGRVRLLFGANSSASRERRVAAGDCRIPSDSGTWPHGALGYAEGTVTAQQFCGGASVVVPRDMAGQFCIASSNNAFERPVKLYTSARVRRVIQFAPSARFGTRRPAAQRER